MRKAKAGIQAAGSEPEPTTGRAYLCAGCWKPMQEEALSVVEETWYSKGFRCAPCAREFEMRKSLGL